MCLMTTLKECVRRFCEVSASQWLEQAGNWTCQKWWCGRCCISGYVLNSKRCDWCRPLHQQTKWKGVIFARRCSWKWIHRKTHLLRWSHIPYQWQGERTQCPYLGNRASTCTDRAPAWLSKSQRFLCGVPRESARPIFLHWSNCDWQLISRHVGKLVVIPTEHKLWQLHSATGRCSPPTNFHRNVLQVLLSGVLQQRAAKGDNHLPWPPRSLALTPCDFFLWGFVKDSVYVPPLPMSLIELCDQITHALQTITVDMLHRVWDEFDYRVDVCHVTQGAHIEGLWLTHEKLGQLLLLTVCVVPV